MLREITSGENNYREEKIKNTRVFRNDGIKNVSRCEVPGELEAKAYKRRNSPKTETIV